MQGIAIKQKYVDRARQENRTSSSIVAGAITKMYGVQEVEVGASVIRVAYETGRDLRYRIPFNLQEAMLRFDETGQWEDIYEEQTRRRKVGVDPRGVYFPEEIETEELETEELETEELETEEPEIETSEVEIVAETQASEEPDTWLRRRLQAPTGEHDV